MKDINIVIVNYKMKEDVSNCLESLFNDIQNNNLDIRVTIVDNGSDDQVDKYLAEKYPLVQVIMKNKNEGFGKAQNEGIKSCEAKYYFALNPDTIFPPGKNIIYKLFAFMEKNPKIGMIGPKIENFDGTIQYSCFRFPTFWQPIFSRTKFGKNGLGKKINDKFLMKDFNHNETRPVDWLMGSAMFVRQQAVKEVGLFDDCFWMYAEDSDWCRRMWEAHWPVYYIHDIVIRHAHSRGSAKVPGILNALIKNKLARVHLISWLKYMWKWRGRSI